jgi:preprotein translocase subunit SecD
VNKNLRWKFIVILGVVALSVWSFYPPSQKVNLGLDLRGGVHMVMRVQTDAALRIEGETTVERLREALNRAGVQYTKLEVTGPTTFVAEGISNDQAFRQAAVEADTVYARSSGAGSYTYTMRPNIETQLRDETVTQALQTIERRVNELGVAEPIVARQGAANEILVQLPGVTDVARAKEIIRSTALLELKLVEQGPFPTQEAALAAVNNNLPPDMVIVSGSEDVAAAAGGTPTTVYYIVRRVAPITGRTM